MNPSWSMPQSMPPSMPPLQTGNLVGQQMAGGFPYSLDPTMGPNGGEDNSKTPTTSFGFTPGPTSLGQDLDLMMIDVNAPAHQMGWEFIEADEGNLSASPASVLTPDLPPQDNVFPLDTLEYQQQLQNMNTDQIPYAPLEGQHINMQEFYNPQQMPQQSYNNTTFAMPMHPRPPLLCTQSEPQQVPQQMQRQYRQQSRSAMEYVQQPPLQEPWNQWGQMRSPTNPQADVPVFDDLSPTANYTYTPSVRSYSSMSPGPASNALIPRQMRGTSLGSSQDPRMSSGLSPPRVSPLSSPSESLMSYPSDQAQAPMYNTMTMIPGVSFSNTTPLDSAYQGRLQSPQSASALSDGGFYSGHESDFAPSSAVTQRYQDDASSTIIAPVQQQVPIIGPPVPPTPDLNRRTNQAKKKEKARGGASSRGGRAKHTHLAPKIAQKAAVMRGKACWPCSLQRDSCEDSPEGQPCRRCLNRAQRPNCDKGLPCSRQKLIELTPSFLPDLITWMYKRDAIEDFCRTHIAHWTNKPIKLDLIAGRGFPTMTWESYEFVPKTQGMLRQWQWFTNHQTGEPERKEIRSPPLGMQFFDQTNVKIFEDHVDHIVDNYFEEFSAMAFADEKNDFQKRLLKLMHGLDVQQKNEAKLLRNVFRLLVATYMTSHSLTIVPYTLDKTLSQLSYTHITRQTNFVQPKMANRQLKLLFSIVHHKALDAVLSGLQQVLKSSKGGQSEKWVASFCAMVGLAMCHEDSQKQIRLVMRGRADRGECSSQDARCLAENACEEIDRRFEWIETLFWWKYGKERNPLWEVGMGGPGTGARSIRGMGAEDVGEETLRFARAVKRLAEEHSGYLFERQRVSTSQENWSRYTSRLVSRFLSTFWAPRGLQVN